MSDDVQFWKPPPPSDWSCYLIGKPGGKYSTIFTPSKGDEPNWFHRKMQRLCFGVRWVKVRNGKSC